MTHICVVGKLTIIGSGNVLSPDRHQAIIRTNAGIMLIWPLGTNFSEIYTLSFKKMYLTMSSGKWRLFCLGLNVLRWISGDTLYCNRPPTRQLQGRVIDILRPRQNGYRFADDIFKLIFKNENFQIKIYWNMFLCYWPLCFTGHRWIPLTIARSFDVFFDLHLNKLLSKQSKCRWFETTWRSLWRHYDVIIGLTCKI